VLIENLL